MTASDADYRAIRDLSDADALKLARRLLKAHPDPLRIMRRIIAEENRRADLRLVDNDDGGGAA